MADARKATLAAEYAALVLMVYTAGRDFGYELCYNPVLRTPNKTSVRLLGNLILNNELPVLSGEDEICLIHLLGSCSTIEHGYYEEVRL